MVDVLPVKDPDESKPVPTAWRSVITEVVRAFIEGDFELARGIDSVEAVDPEAAEQIKSYLEDYGETLVVPSEDCWETSIAQWQEMYWELLVDLWTEESGESDLVLHIRAFESGSGFSFRIDSVYVP